MPSILKTFASFIRKNPFKKIIETKRVAVETRVEIKIDEPPPTGVKVNEDDEAATVPPPHLCRKCDVCIKCSKSTDKETIEKKRIAEKTRNVKALHKFMFFVMFIIYFVSYLTVWVLIIY